MADIKTRVQGIDPNLRARDISEMADETDNIYKTISIIQKRARQLNLDIKQELHTKLEEFAVVTDRIEEIQENKEQIEISKFYERLPNPTVIATNEFLSGKLTVTDRSQEVDQEAEEEL
ncbi:MAG: DNA-directed RNA polymerase subunit omega [Bacteroidota bacterium]